MPYTFEAARRTAQKVREARDFLEVPIAVENVSSYAEYHVSEMTNGSFSMKWWKTPTAVFCSTSTIFTSRPAIIVLIRLNTCGAFPPSVWPDSHSRALQLEKYILDTHDIRCSIRVAAICQGH